MATKKTTVSVRLDEEAHQRVNTAAKLTKQSLGSFLEAAGEQRAHQVLLDWVVTSHRQGSASFSELAQQTGLAIEEIMRAVGDQGRDDALAMFLASCETVAATRNDPEFLRLGREAVADLANVWPDR